MQKLKGRCTIATYHREDTYQRESTAFYAIKLGKYVLVFSESCVKVYMYTLGNNFLLIMTYQASCMQKLKCVLLAIEQRRS